APHHPPPPTGEPLASSLDVTIVYPAGACGFMAFFGGKMRKVIVRVREIPVPKDFYDGDYAGDAAFRQRVHSWVSEIWAEKDQLIDSFLPSSTSERAV
ncbi:MAG: hypothetical protein RLN67_07140, partial [Algiphilus sp.]